MGEALDRVKSTIRKLKVFPLPSVVMLPGTVQPLHIFEQRYRDLVKDALAGDGVFALAQVVPGQEGRLPGSPELESMLCAGVIGVHELLEDGRYNLVLVGVCRARVVKELPQRAPYREVEAELVEDATIESEEELPLRQAVLELMARVPDEVGDKVAQVTGRLHGGLLADVVAGTVLHDVAARFEVLTQTDVRVRLREVTDEVMQLVARLKPRKPEGLLN
ncbi:MAG: LON peptidase substrate-binding domain-containing protein [Myxococcales bacterium]|nr:LON peptidase substrate-binding domain-containing protein [Myxococcales bacterium]